MEFDIAGWILMTMDGTGNLESCLKWLSWFFDLGNIQASFWMAKWKGVVVQAKTDTIDTFVSLIELGMIMAAHCSPQDWST